MYTLKNDGASTDPWGRPFFKIRFRLTWLPRNTRKFRWLIRPIDIDAIVINIQYECIGPTCGSSFGLDIHATSNSCVCTINGVF